MTAGAASTGAGRAPALVGPYRLVQQIGEGGMGVVHLAVAPDGRAVALKMLRAQVAADPQARQRLGREVATLRRVRHPRVAEVLDADVDGEAPYVVTRYVPGRTLEDLVRERGPMPPGHLAGLATGLADALRAIHAAGVVHRDLKPANVMLVDDEPVVIDFGIAHLADESRITVTGLVMGTPGYLSPEVVEGQEVTRATDWWGWAATLGFAAAGRAPFGTGNPTVVLDRVRRGAADLGGVSPRVRDVLAVGLAPEPVRRPPAEWVVPALVEAARADQVALAAGTRPVAAPAPSPSQAPTVLTPGPHAAPTVVTPSPGSAAPPVQAPTQVRQPLTPTLPQPQQPGGAGPASGPGAPDAPYGHPSPTPVAAVGFVALCALAAVVPGAALVLLFALCVVARTADRTVLGLLRRRYAYGRRGSDVPAAVAALPWRLLSALARSALGLVLPLLVGGSLAFIVGGLRTSSGVASGPGAPLSLAVAMSGVLATTFWAPGGGALRRGTAWMVRGLSRDPRRRAVTVGVVALVTVAAVLAGWSTTSQPDWAPFVAPAGTTAGLPGWLHAR